MADTLYLDLETYCALDLTKVGAYRYSEHSSYRTLMSGWALNDGPVGIVFPTDPDWHDFLNLVQDPYVEKVAHNAAFDRVCLSRHLTNDPFSFLDPAQWFDTGTLAVSKGYPGKLEKLAPAIGAPDKDDAGTALIRLFSKPNRGKRITEKERPEDWARFVEYCRQDVDTLREVRRLLGDWEPIQERTAYIVDQLINDRGIRVDLDLVDAAVRSTEDYAIQADLELTRITGLANPNSRDQFLGWLHEKRVPVTNLQKETVDALLESPVLDPVVREAVEIRSGVALAAVKKYPAIQAMVNDDGRLRGQFRFFGAHTGRWSGRGVQLQNLPRASLKDELATDLAVLDLKMGFGAPPEVLKALVRSSLLLDGVVVDYAAIEARVIAWLAHEEWALEAFRRGRDIYVETAQRMSTPGNTLTRSQGKVAVLALGYNGGINSLRVMGAEGTDQELQNLVTQWRKANPRIVSLWKELEAAFAKGGTAGRLEVVAAGNTRYLVLPSGRPIVYRKVRFQMVEGKYGPQRRATFQTTVGYRADTYGGRLAENATQAVARDILSEAMVRLEDQGYPVVGHVHDEVLVESTPADQLDEVRAVMCARPRWAQDLPLNGEGFYTTRYRKG